MWIKNVKLEDGFISQNGVITGTRTRLVSLEIEDGVIKSI